MKILETPQFGEVGGRNWWGDKLTHNKRTKIQAGAMSGVQYVPVGAHNRTGSYLAFDVRTGEKIEHQASLVRFYDKHIVVAPHKQEAVLPNHFCDRIKILCNRAWLDGDWVFRVPSELSRDKCDHILFFTNMDVRMEHKNPLKFEKYPGE